MRLTKTSLTLLAIIAMLVVAERFLPDWARHVWPLVTAGWLFLLLSERIILLFQKIDVERLLAKQLYLGESTTITYRITNRNKYPVRLLTEEILPAAITTKQNQHEWNLSSKQCLHQDSTIKPISLGVASFTQINTTVLGRLALAWWTRRIKLPKITEIKPDYRTVPLPTKSRQNDDLLSAVDLPAQQPITLVINADRLNQLVSGDLRRVDNYINTCSKIASRAIETHCPVNFIVYDIHVRLVICNIKNKQQLGSFFTRLQQLTETENKANHRCLLPWLDKIQQPGLLLWCTDLDDAYSTVELEKIAHLYKQRFKILFYSQGASENAVMNDELDNHCRSSYHKLEILKLQHQWRVSRQILQRSGIACLAR